VQRIFQLKGKVQHYSWGGYDYIPKLLCMDNAEQKPYAEYWLGAHPQQPSTITIGDKEVSLDQFVQREDILGKKASTLFQSLPYLFKILDVKQMLSIQVHPSKAAAKQCFEKENEAGIPLSAPNRNYKDDNHKPEMMVALSNFWLLHGFKSPSAIRQVLDHTPELKSLTGVLEKKGLQGLYDKVMNMPQDEVNSMLKPLAARIVPLYKLGQLNKTTEDFWAARAIQTFTKNGQWDRGIFSIYFLNLVYLKKGEGIFQPSGMPHAYLEGQNVELMANSDNVLRAGLTDKHIDVQELMRHIDYRTTEPVILHADQNKRYFAPVDEFGLFQYILESNNEEVWETKSAEILLVIEGKAEIFTGEEKLSLEKGKAVFIIANSPVKVIGVKHSILFRATVGIT
jgi:mannose-6-phosphate isomerase